MSILATPATAPTLAQAAAEGVRAKATQGFTDLVADFRELFGRIWRRADGVTPQQVFDQFGTDAAKLFASAEATIAYLQAFCAANGLTLADYIAPADYTPPLPYAIGSDGTVVVNPPAPATSPA